MNAPRKRTGATSELLLTTLSRLSYALLALPAVVISALATGAVVAVATGAARPNVMLFVLAAAAFVTIQYFRDALARGTTLLGAEDASIAIAERSAGGVTVFDPALTLQRAVLGTAQSGATLDGDRVDGLREIVDRAVGPLPGGTVAAITVLPEPWAAAVDGERVLIGSASLAALSPQELEALIAREWLLAHDPRSLRVAEAAKRAVAVGGFSKANGRPSLLQRIHGLSTLLARPIERVGSAYVHGVRRRVDGAVAERHGAAVLQSALDRESVAISLWPTTVDRWQRLWIDGTDAVRPYASWEAEIAGAAATARSVRLVGANRMDALSALGWKPTLLGTIVSCPPQPDQTVMQALDHPDVVRATFDDVLAAAYYDPDVTEHVLVGGAWRLDEPEDWAALVQAGDSPTAAGDLLERQVDALTAAMYRRDGTALEVARTIEAASATETVRAMAAGVAYLAGEPEARARVETIVRGAPRCSPVLAGLDATMLVRGDDALADALDAAVARFAGVSSAALGLQDLFKAHRRIHPTSVPTDGQAVIREVVGTFPSSSRAWLLDVVVDQGTVPVLVIDEGPDRAATDENHWWRCRFAVPDLRILDYSDLEACARWSLGRRATVLPTKPAPRGAPGRTQAARTASRP